MRKDSREPPLRIHSRSRRLACRPSHAATGLERRDLGLAGRDQSGQGAAGVGDDAAGLGDDRADMLSMLVVTPRSRWASWDSSVVSTVLIWVVTVCAAVVTACRAVDSCVKMPVLPVAIIDWAWVRA